MMGGASGHLPLESAVELVRKHDGAGTDVPAPIYEAWLCGFLEVSPPVLEEMDDMEIASHVGYRMGVNLARRCSQLKEEKSNG